MKKQRKHYTPEKKVAILRRHLLERKPIWNLCDELGLQPTVFLPLAEGFRIAVQTRTGDHARSSRFRRSELCKCRR